MLRWHRLSNADAILNSDEAVDGLTLRHLVLEGELTPFNWDTQYYGITEGLLTLPAIALLGWTSLALKVGALCGLLLLAVALFSWVNHLWGLRAGAAAVSVPLFLSPQTEYWSLLAGGGYLLTCAFGAWALRGTARLINAADSGSRPRQVVALGLLLGFGLYTYQLFVVFLIAVLAALAIALLARRRLPPWRESLLLLAGILVGWAPYWLGVWLTPPPGWSPPTEFATLDVVRSNLRILTTQALPALVGLWDPAVPALGTEFRAFRWMLLAASGGSLVACSLRRPASAAVVAARLGLLLVAVNLALFLFSRAPQDWSSNRYLLPSVVALSLGIGAFVGAAERWRSIAGALSASSIIALLALGHAQAVLRSSFVTSSREILRIHEPLTDVVDALAAREVKAGYAPYRIAYRATYLAQEGVVLDGIDWSRSRDYAMRADRSASPAWIFATANAGLDEIRAEEAHRARQRFEQRLESLSLRPETVDLPPYRIYLSGPSGRLFPTPIRQPPRPLGDPRASLSMVSRPPHATVGEPFRIRVQVTNQSDTFWSVNGDGRRAGIWQVNLSYRWLRPDGTVVVEYGERSPIPYDLAPGEQFEASMGIVAPPDPGPLVLRVTLVQEGVAWFDQASNSLVQTAFDVRPSATDEVRIGWGIKGQPGE